MLSKKGSLLFIFFILINLSYVSALRISPAKFNFDFSPGLEKEIEFRIDSFGDDELEIFIEGELAEYFTINESKLPKEGGFITVKFNLPEEFEIPGRKSVFIGAREIVDEELAAGAVIVAVAIQAVVYIDVPYPGKYLESSFKAHNSNINEPITFNLNIDSKGKNRVSFIPKIEIYSELGELLDTLEFKERTMNSGEKLELKKIWDTAGYSRGGYYALSKIDYGDRIAESRVDFKIGDLIIEIIDHSKQIIKEGIKPFLVEIESGWNDKIDGAYAEVSFSNETKLYLLSFRTSPTNLDPWQKKEVTGYFDTDELALGKYAAKITVFYYGKSVGKSVSENVAVEIIKKEKANYLLISSVVFGGITALIIIFLILKTIFFKHGKRK